MTRDEFHNALRVMHNIDSWDFPDPCPKWYSQFASNPIHFFIRCDDERCDMIWKAMQNKGVK